MSRVAWLTDLHLDFLDEGAVRDLLGLVEAEEPDAVLLGGDSAHAGTIVKALGLFRARLRAPIYFVLGNHDYYGGSIAEVRAAIRDLARRDARLVWLGETGVVELSRSVGLIGHDGWSDGRHGDFFLRPNALNDYARIAELSGVSAEERLVRLHALGDEAAAHVRARLPEALERFPHVVFLTHVPPFREACTHEGIVGDDLWVPHFTCRAAGDALLEVMAARPDRRLTVLCGHTHDDFEVRVRENIEVHVAGAEYGRIALPRMLGFP